MNIFFSFKPKELREVVADFYEIVFLYESKKWFALNSKFHDIRQRYSIELLLYNVPYIEFHSLDGQTAEYLEFLRRYMFCIIRINSASIF
ncbi:MAG: hypothetical protein J5798_13950 [Spirochaetaceae bacterium]|nr:hypothetical protein [Spirochaetaceae bacterium]